MEYPAPFQNLYTAEGEALSGTPWEDYPRPQLRRKDWLCLNGDWDFSCESGTGTIRVPFCPESLLSGFLGRLRYGETLRYSRRFTLPAGWINRRVLLHFGAVSRVCEVFLNGKRLGSHDNAYLPFSFDASEALLPGENLLELSVVNDLSPRSPIGKQREKRGGMWYTPVSGVWQTVWLEPVPETYIRKLTIRADASGAEIAAEGVDTGELVCEGRRYPLENGRVRVEPPEKRLWTPETPYLYEFTLRSGEDEAQSYFALRSLTVETAGGIPRLCLNGAPYFFHGLLDQGYFSDGLYTPAAPQLYEQDIRRMKALGFNMLRKHIKIEPERFYYDCDRLGMAVFQDMVCCGGYRFFRDTLLPTLGVQALRDERLNPDPALRQSFLEAMRETAETLGGHPCVCAWTIFNEGWGQFEADAAYDALRSVDDSRFIDAASGWFRQKKSDVESLHVYFGKLRLGKDRGRPQFLSEFGGYVWKSPEHSFNPKKTYGYKIFRRREDFASALRSVYLEELVPLTAQGLCAAVYTQVSDVEDETNGLLSYDRKLCKLAPEELSGISEALQSAVKGEVKP